MSASHTLTDGCEVSTEAGDGTRVFVVLEGDVVIIQVGTRGQCNSEIVAVPRACVAWLRDTLGRIGT